MYDTTKNKADEHRLHRNFTREKITIKLKEIRVKQHFRE